MTLKNSHNQSAQIDSATTYEVDDFENNFNTHWSRVYGVIYRIVGDPAEAQDLALETFLRLHQSPPRHGTNLNGWLYRVSTHLAFNALRARKRRAGYEEEAGAALFERKAATPPNEVIERVEERRRVRQVLSRMKVRSAKILILRHSGLSYAEIADAVGVSSSSVGTLLSRAEQEFEKRYKLMDEDR